MLGIKPKRTWEEAVIRWISESSKKSLSTDKSHCRFLQPYLTGRHLDEIDKDLIEKIIKAKLATGCSKTRVNRLTSLIGAILNKAKKEWEWIDAVPHIRKFSEPKKRLRWLTPEEVERLLAELPDHTRAMAVFSLATGLRESKHPIGMVANRSATPGCVDSCGPGQRWKGDWNPIKYRCNRYFAATAWETSFEGIHLQREPG
jgi:integrase